METRSCRDPGRSHGWRAVHARYSRRTPTPHSAACPWRAHVFVVLVAPPAPRPTDTALLRRWHSCYRNCSSEGLSGWSATRTEVWPGLFRWRAFSEWRVIRPERPNHVERKSLRPLLVRRGFRNRYQNVTAFGRWSARTTHSAIRVYQDLVLTNV